MGKEVFFTILFILILIPLVSAPFGYNNPSLPQLEKVDEFIKKTGDSATGNYDFNGDWMNGGFSIRGGDIYAQQVFTLNLTSLNVTKQNLTIIGNLTLNDMVKGSVLFAGDNGLISQDNSNLFWDDTNKFLGVGTNTPGGILNMYSESEPTMYLTQSAGSQTAWISTATYSGIGTISTHPFKIIVDETIEAIHIAVDGDVGIGTNSPYSGLHYQGDIFYLILYS